MSLIPAGNQSPSFFSISGQKKERTNHYLAAWQIVEKDFSPIPILFPEQPKGSALFYEEGMSRIVNALTFEKYPSIEVALSSVKK